MASALATLTSALKLLSELLLDRANYMSMTKYIGDPENLKAMMNMLRDKSKNIQFEAFHVFKVFVANPEKPADIAEIQARIISRSDSPNCFLGGMCGSAPGARNWYNRLFSGSPGTTAGPSSPPFNTASGVSSSSPLFRSIGPWHFTQCRSRIGRTCVDHISPASAPTAMLPGHIAKASNRTFRMEKPGVMTSHQPLRISRI